MLPNFMRSEMLSTYTNDKQAIIGQITTNNKQILMQKTVESSVLYAICSIDKFVMYNLFLEFTMTQCKVILLRLRQRWLDFGLQLISYVTNWIVDKAVQTNTCIHNYLAIHSVFWWSRSANWLRLAFSFKSTSGRMRVDFQGLSILPVN